MAPKRAWVVMLLTTDSYVPGILTLAYSLRQVHSRYPLVVVVNPQLPETARAALKAFDLDIIEVEPLTPKESVDYITERFVDTWTKLRVFQLDQYEKIVLIDGDMMLRKNMDELFDLPLDKDQLAASQACVCNLENASWAPKNWNRENCPFTGLKPPHDAHFGYTVSPNAPKSHHLLNSGLVVLTPSTTTMKKMEDLLETASSDMLNSWICPDQDLLAHFFRGKWKPLPWKYNALKTMRYWHGSFWRDEEVINIHYICDKPWARRPKLLENEQEGKRYVVDAGRFSGYSEGDLAYPREQADAVTHDWWWACFDTMRDQMKEAGYPYIAYVDSLVAV